MFSCFTASRNTKEEKQITHEEIIDVLQIRVLEYGCAIARSDFVCRTAFAQLKNAPIADKPIIRQQLKSHMSLKKQQTQIQTNLILFINTVRQAAMNASAVDALDYSSKNLKLLNDQLSVLRVENIIDECEEQTQLTNEVSSALANMKIELEPIDLNQLDKEIDAMEQKEADELELPSIEKQEQQLATTKTKTRDSPYLREKL